MFNTQELGLVGDPYGKKVLTLCPNKKMAMMSVGILSNGTLKKIWIEQEDVESILNFFRQWKTLNGTVPVKNIRTGFNRHDVLRLEESTIVEEHSHDKTTRRCEFKGISFSIFHRTRHKITGKFLVNKDQIVVSFGAVQAIWGHLNHWVSWIDKYWNPEERYEKKESTVVPPSDTSKTLVVSPSNLH